MGDEVVETPFGKFLIDPQDLIGSTLKAGTLWDGPGFLQPIALEYGRLGTPGITILDVGANQGAFSVWLAHHDAWRVIAVEPVPQVMQRLKANLDLNKAVCADRVIPVEIAAYDCHAKLWAKPLDLGNWGGTSLSRVSYDRGVETLVSAIPLDNLRWMYGDRVSLIKIDAQGCDGAAIMGLRHTIERDHPTIVFEWEEDLSRAHDWLLTGILSWLVTCGYEVNEWPSQPHNYLARFPG